MCVLVFFFSSWSFKRAVVEILSREASRLITELSKHILFFLMLNLNHNRNDILGGPGRGLSGVTLATCFSRFQ